MDVSTSLEVISRWDQLLAERFPRRFTGKQKAAFLDAIDQELQASGYETERITNNSFGIVSRVLATTCASPKVIFMAHYDTPMMMPFWIMPVYALFGHTRQIASTLILMAGIWLATNLDALLPQVPYMENVVGLLLFVLVASFLVMAFANPSNREDNTSGVIGLLALAEWVKDQPELKERVQFAFLDNEEWGLLGSGGLKKVWDRRGHPYQNADIIALDCVSRGSVPLVVYHHKHSTADRVLPFLKEHLPAARLINMRWVPLSDNYTFQEQGAIDISFADPSLIPGGYYIPRIHVPADKDFSAPKLDLLVSGLKDYLLSRAAPPPPLS